jgi:hypothetical protein
MAAQWTDADWRTLIARIRAGQVTPVLGAGASASIVGGAAEVALAWAEDVGYPFDDADRLPAVAHYVATMQDRARPGEYVGDTFTAVLDGFVVADIADRHDPYRALPQYGFPVWLTTNYDDLIRRALNSANKPPKVGVASWTPPDLYWDASAYDLTGFTPEPDHPLVFHLHGRFEDPPSMVITEADYLEFLEQLSRTDRVLPNVVEKAIATTSLLFIGYSFRDVNLQLVLRQWRIPRLAYLVRPLPPNLSDSQLDAYVDYYPRYLKTITGADFKLYWGAGSEFCADLHEFLEGGAP